jgi:hypothetical protein
MDWRHMGEILEAGHSAYSGLQNLCVWAKDNGAMSSFYRLQHEFVFVWKAGEARHLNTVQLGKTGRYPPNIWSYRRATKTGQNAELAMHPTVKPVTMIMDAIKDTFQALKDRARSVWRLWLHAHRGVGGRACGCGLLAAQARLGAGAALSEPEQLSSTVAPQIVRSLADAPTVIRHIQKAKLVRPHRGDVVKGGSQSCGVVRRCSVLPTRARKKRQRTGHGEELSRSTDYGFGQK